MYKYCTTNGTANTYATIDCTGYVGTATTNTVGWMPFYHTLNDKYIQNWINQLKRDNIETVISEDEIMDILKD